MKHTNTTWSLLVDVAVAVIVVDLLFACRHDRLEPTPSLKTISQLADDMEKDLVE